MCDWLRFALGSPGCWARHIGGEAQREQNGSNSGSGPVSAGGYKSLYNGTDDATRTMRLYVEGVASLQVQALGRVGGNRTLQAERDNVLRESRSNNAHYIGQGAGNLVKGTVGDIETKFCSVRVQLALHGVPSPAQHNSVLVRAKQGLLGIG